ncbi:OmpA family protein [Burkholderia sp. BCC1999]|uniref:OmpA family protein n=1 Tax=Burkholderia sp. BCC1999 TaxID=2817448 RepID=UPI002AC3520F|nr:OmpA family protein [Burkholderia sp. BCC1999]
MKTMLAARVAACLWCTGGFAALPAHAGDAADMRPSAADIVHQLAPHGASRSLRGIVVERAPVRTQDDMPGPSVNLAIQFEFSSARFTPGSRVLLDNLGHALSDDALAHARFRIVGHTDASGNASANLALSRRRAQAVADYLVSSFGIDGTRLAVEGVGSARPKDPAHPRAAVNRRVEVVNLDGGE